MMKKIYKTMFVAGAALALTACSNEEPGYDNGGDGSVSFTIEIPAGLTTRAINNGQAVNNLQVAVFDNDGTFVFQKDFGAFHSGDEVKVNLISGNTYTVAFWADKKDGPYTIKDGQLEVNYDGAIANDDSRDAFYGAREITVTKNNLTQSISLFRPFAQVNLGTDDYEIITETYNCKPSTSTMEVQGCAYKNMNLLDGNVSGSVVDVTFSAAVMPECNTSGETPVPQTLTSGGNPYAWIGMNYILCDKKGGTISKLVFSTEDTKLGTRIYDNCGAPVKRNMRTNIVGSLFTSASGWTVTLETGISEPWDGQVATAPVVDPVKKTVAINKPTDLPGFADMVNGENNTRDANQIEALNFKDFTVTLNCDVDLNNMEWTPIGNGSRDNETYTGNAFKGTFDGNGHTIYGLKISQTNGEDVAKGLFGVVDGGTVKNLNIVNAVVDVKTSKLAAIAVGMLTGGGVVDKVTVSGTLNAIRGCAGIVGRMTISGTIKNCENNATISGTGANVAGICGAAYYTREDKKMVIDNCVNNGKVTCTAGNTGGIAGLSAAWVSNCENNAEIVGEGACVAGVVAEQQNAGGVTKCVNYKNVTNKIAKYGTAGIVGWLRYSGKVEDYTVKNIVTVSECVNHGSVAGGNDAGGIVGTLYHLGEVKDNENYAASLQGVKFAAGIVGNIQFTESTPGLNYDDSVVVKDNVSTTSIDNISAGCKGLYFYDNDSNHGKVKAEGNRQSK